MTANTRPTTRFFASSLRPSCATDVSWSATFDRCPTIQSAAAAPASVGKALAPLTVESAKLSGVEPKRYLLTATSAALSDAQANLSTALIAVRSAIPRRLRCRQKIPVLFGVLVMLRFWEGLEFRAVAAKSMACNWLKYNVLLTESAFMAC